MFSRRVFVGCALCAATKLFATAATAQSAPTAPPGATTSGLKRTILQTIEGPTPGYVTLVVEVEIPAGAEVARHTHPGIESSYIISGSTELIVEGQPNRIVSAGQAFQVPAGVPHAAKNGNAVTKLAANYIVEKGKPLASPA